MEDAPAPLRFRFLWNEEEYRKLYAAISQHRDRLGSRAKAWIIRILLVAVILAVPCGNRPSTSSGNRLLFQTTFIVCAGFFFGSTITL